MEAREIRGIWWLAGTPKKYAQPGVLSVSKKGLRLDCDTDLKSDIDWTTMWGDPEARAPLVRVFGEIVSRRPTPVTLDRCFFVRDQMSLVANDATIGTAFRSDRPISFREIRFKTSHLNSWSAGLDRNGFERKWQVDEPKPHFRLEWREPAPCIATLADGTRIEVATHLHEGTWGPAIASAELSQESEIRILFPKRYDLHDIQKIIYRLRNFVALGVGSGVQMLRMYGYKAPIPEFPRDPFFALTEILYGLVEPDEEAHDSNPLRMPFVLSDIVNRFDEHINRWFDAVDRLGTVVDMYFSTLHARPYYSETRFLMYIQALEGYHRRTFEGTVWSRDEWAELKQQLLNDVAPNYARKLGGRRLDMLNWVSLGSRLSQLIKICPRSSERILRAGRTAKGDFIQKVEATRNDQAHLLIPPPRRAAKGNDLHRLTAQVRALLEALLLIEAGFSDEDIREMLWRGGRINDIRVW